MKKILFLILLPFFVYAQDSEKVDTCFVNDNGVLRSGPKKESKIITKIQKGDTVLVFNRLERYYEVKSKNHRGWILDVFIDCAKDTDPPPESIGDPTQWRQVKIGMTPAQVFKIMGTKHYQGRDEYKSARLNIDTHTWRAPGYTIIIKIVNGRVDTVHKIL